MFVPIHSKVSVDDLLHGVIIQSGNDACITLAEGIAGSEDKFAEMMTKRAREIGLPKSTFGNSNGLPNPRQLHDGARARQARAAHHPDLSRTITVSTASANSPSTRSASRTAIRCLALNIGADGMKTGFTKEAGYGLVGSAVQNGMRLIVVVNGLKTEKERADEAKKLLEWGFHNFQANVLFDEGQSIADAKVYGGDQGYVPLVAERPVQLMVPRGVREKIIARVVYCGPVRAPVQKGQKIGVLKVWRGDVDGARSAAAGGRRVSAPAICPAAHSTPRANSSSGCSAPASSGYNAALRSSPRERGERSGSGGCRMRGQFITFEGGEGTGKSTHAALLAQRLRALGIGVVLTREPGGSPGAEIIRHVLLSGAAKPFGPSAEAILFAAARDDHVRNTIEPALARGRWVICDRFIDSTRVYQGVLGKVDPSPDQGARTRHRRRPQARSHLHPRRAGRDRARARGQAARRRRGRPVRGRDARVPREAARRLPARWRPASRTAAS